jgi:hypothetical protein
MERYAELSAREAAREAYRNQKPSPADADAYRGQYGEAPAKYRTRWSRRFVLNAWTPLNDSQQSFLVYADRRTVPLSLTCQDTTAGYPDLHGAMYLQSERGEEATKPSAHYL